VLFADGHAAWLLPEIYHSSTKYADELGNPVPPSPAAVSENIWRNYWDVSYSQ